MANAPVELLGWDEGEHCWAARRDGEPAFRGVQDLGDAYMACASRDAELIVSEAVYTEMVASGDAPPERPRWARLPRD